VLRQDYKHVRSIGDKANITILEFKQRASSIYTYDAVSKL